MKTLDISEFLGNLNQKGVQLWGDREKLKINAPKGMLTPQIQSALAAHKTEILAFLREQDNSSSQTPTGLSLQTIGRLIGGFRPNSPMEFRSPIIDPKIMARQLTVTFRPLPGKFRNETILKFRAELEQKLQECGVEIISWENATRDFAYEILIPLTRWKKTIETRVVRPDISAVIDVCRPVSTLKSFIAEKIYQIYAQFFLSDRDKSIATIARLTAWAEDRAMQRLEDPTATQVIVLTELDRDFADPKLPYQKKIAIGAKTLVETLSEIVIGVSDSYISILNMNLSDSIFSRKQFGCFAFNSLIPKIFVPIAPLPLSRFEIGNYNPHKSVYAAKLQQMSRELTKTGLFPSGFKLAERIKRQSHRDIVNSIVSGRTGVSYGFVAYMEPPQYEGDREIPGSEWQSLSPVAGLNPDEVRQNASGRRYVKTKLKKECAYRQIPDIWLVCSRSGANKTDLNLECDILRIGLKGNLHLQIPKGIDPTQVDIKPSYDTYVMVAIALSAALYAPELIENGAPAIHFHGYPSREWFEPHEYWSGVEHPSVPCGTYESGVFNFLSIFNLAKQNDSSIALASLIEPDHGTNIIASNFEYLLARLQAGIEREQIELGGRYFASLTEQKSRD